jgi:brefeldin A-resistance guanine nucleotide exchange factor 1
MVNSPDFWSTLRALEAVPEVANDVFTLVEGVITGQTSALTTDNYEPVIVMLSDYATAGSVGAQEEQRREMALRRGKGAALKKAAPNHVVSRGQRAIQLVYEATARVPHFIQQSHLETQEGIFT